MAKRIRKVKSNPKHDLALFLKSQVPTCMEGHPVSEWVEPADVVPGVIKSYQQDAQFLWGYLEQIADLAHLTPGQFKARALDIAGRRENRYNLTEDGLFKVVRTGYATTPEPNRTKGHQEDPRLEALIEDAAEAQEAHDPDQLEAFAAKGLAAQQGLPWWVQPEHVVEGSSNIHAARYLPSPAPGGGSSLEIRFSNGGTYRYMGVERKTFAEFQAAKSKGSYLHKYIKSTYECVKVPD